MAIPRMFIFGQFLLRAVINDYVAVLNCSIDRQYFSICRFTIITILTVFIKMFKKVLINCVLSFYAIVH